MAYNEALKRAQQKYNLSHESVHLRLEIGTLKAIEETGQNRTAFIREAIREKLERETGKNGKL